MKNLLSSVIDKAAEEIISKQYKDALPEFTDESDKIKDPECRKEYKEAFDKAKEDMEKRGQEMLDSANERVGATIRQVKTDLRDLGTSLGYLSVGTAQFAARIAMVPPAIISVVPLGIGVSAQLVPPLLQQLKAEGDNLSAVYDEVNSKIEKLGLKALVGSIPVVGSIMSIVDTTQAIAKPLISLVGADVSDIVGSLPEVDLPIPVPELSASSCTNFTYIVPPVSGEGGDISATNCSRFVALNEGDSTVKCNNCKNYKSRL